MLESIRDVLQSTGFASLNWQMVVMWVIIGALFYLAIVKQLVEAHGGRVDGL